MKSILTATFPIIALWLCGCAATGPAFSPAPTSTEKAIIYIYRPDSGTLRARDAYFYIDNQNVADLSSKGYTWLPVDPGLHSLKQKWPIDLIGFKPIEIKSTWLAGRKYYYRLTPTTRSYFTGVEHATEFKWILAQVDEADAVAELSSTAYQKPNGAN